MSIKIRFNVPKDSQGQLKYAIESCGIEVLDLFHVPISCYDGNGNKCTHLQCWEIELHEHDTASIYCFIAGWNLATGIITINQMPMVE